MVSPRCLGDLLGEPEASTWTHGTGTFLPHPAGRLIPGPLGSSFPSSPPASQRLPQLSPRMAGSGGLHSLPASPAQAGLSPARSCVQQIPRQPPPPPKLSITPAVPRGLGPECRARSAEAAAGPFQEVPNRLRSALLAGSLCQGATRRTPQRVKVLEAWRECRRLSRAAGLVQGQERQRRRCILMNHYCRGGLCLALSGAQ